jgi:hypothetical protein
VEGFQCEADQSLNIFCLIMVHSRFAGSGTALDVLVSTFNGFSNFLKFSYLPPLPKKAYPPGSTQV